MTLGDAKKVVLKLMDEDKPKSDLTDKLNGFFDLGQKEIATVYPIFREYTVPAADADEYPMPEDFYRPAGVFERAGAVLRPLHGYTWGAGNVLRLPRGMTGNPVVQYRAYPQTVDEKTSDSYEFEIAREAQSALLFYVAAQCNATEYDQRFFSSFFAQYQGKLRNLSQEVPFTATVENTGGLL